MNTDLSGGTAVGTTIIGQRWVLPAKNVSVNNARNKISIVLNLGKKMKL